MPYQSPTLTELIKQGQQDIQVNFPNVRMHSVLSVLNRVNAGLSAGEHQHLGWLANQIIPTTADEEYLLEYARMKGIYRKQPASAAGIATFEVASPTTIPENTKLQDDQGQVFVVTQNVQVSAGTADVQIEAEQEGLDGNIAVGTKLSLVSAVLGVKPTATVKSMSGGADIESLDSVRARLLFRVQYPPAGGAPHDYVRWAKEVAGVTRAWCFERYQGGGTVGVAFVLDELSSILPTEQDIAKVKKYIEGHLNLETGQYEGMPANVELFVFPPVLQSINLTIRLVPATVALKQSVESTLKALFAQTGLGGRIYLSHIRAAISNVVGEQDNSVITPTADIELPPNAIAVLGNIVWQ